MVEERIRELSIEQLEGLGESHLMRQSAPLRLVEDKKLVAWLIEAALVASNSDACILRAIAQTPALFPFVVAQINFISLLGNERLELFRQGLDENIVMLRRN